MSENENDVESEFDFSSDDAAREQMREYVKENFGDFLGEKAELLDEPGGLEKIREEFANEIEAAGNNLFDNVDRLLGLLKKLE